MQNYDCKNLLKISWGKQMNIRVVSLCISSLVFALVSGMISYSVSSGVHLNDAYTSGKITVVQQTAAGTVPHQVMITNNASKSVK